MLNIEENHVMIPDNNKPEKLKILTAQQKSFRLFRLQDKNGAYLNENMRLQKYSEVALLPLCTTREELADIVYKFFGSKGYSRFWPRYLFTKKFMYQPSLIAGKKQIRMLSPTTTINEIISHLPKLRTLPTFRYIDKKNIILDFTEQFKLIFPTRKETLLKPPIVNYSEYIYPEIMIRFGIDYRVESHFKYTARYSSTLMQPPLQMNHRALIVPIPIDTVDNKVVQFLLLTKKVPRAMKVNPTYMRIVSMIRFVYKCYANDKNDKNDDPMNYFIDCVNNNNVKFLFYNKKFAFAVDFDELKQRKVTWRSFYTIFKAKLVTLISNNIGIEADENIDSIIKEEDEEETHDITHVSIDATKDMNTPLKKEITTANSEDNDTEEDIVTKRIAHVVEKQRQKTNSDNKIYEKDIKNKTDKVLELINNTKDPDINISFDDPDNPQVVDRPQKGYEQPLTYRQTVDRYGKRKADDLYKDDAHRFRMDEGLELVHPEPSKEEQIRLWENWLLMSDNMKYRSDKTSIKLFKMDNKTHHEKLMATLWNKPISSSSEIKIHNNAIKVNMASNVAATTRKIKPKIDEEEEIEETEDEEYEDTMDDVPPDLLENDVNEEELLKDISTMDEDLEEHRKKKLIKQLERKQKPPKSPAQLRRIAIARDKYKSIVTEDERTIEEILNDVEATQIDVTPMDTAGILDKSVTSASLIDFEKSYIKKTMKKDILNVIKSFSNPDKSIPMHIWKFDEKDTSDQFNNKKTLTFVMEDEEQHRHTIKFDVPVPNEDGVLFIKGNKKVLKKQIFPLPVIKIGPDEVAVTSMHNKMIIARAGTVLNRKIVVIKKLVDEYLRDDETGHFEVKYGDNIRLNLANENYITTIEYDVLAKKYSKFIVGGRGKRTIFYFNQTELRKEIQDKQIPYKFRLDYLPIGIDYAEGKVLEFNLKDEKSSIGDIILTVFREKAPLHDIGTIINSIAVPKRRIYSRIRIINSKVPLVMLLGYLYGIQNVINVSKLNCIFSNKKQKDSDWLYIRFKDKYLYYPEYPLENSLLFNGLTEMNTEDYNFEDLEAITPYVDYVRKAFNSSNILKGYTATKELFIDNITKSVLEDFNLPTDFLELLLYANDLLTDSKFSHSTEAANYRIRGYELISQALYRALSDEYKILKQKGNKLGSPLSIPPDCIMKILNDSQILENYDTINPINELKSKSACTFKGQGLVGAAASHDFPLSRRAFGKDAIGIFAESNLDNHQVGISKELTINPGIVSTRGYLSTTKDKKQISKMSASQVMSPDELISPDVTQYDHPNRVGFSSGQWKHTLGVTHNCLPMVSSGYDKVVAHQVGDTYIKKAKMKGKIIDIDEEKKMIVIEYKDGSREVQDYNTNYNKNSNFFLENTFELNVKVGQSVKENDILAYSKEFFIKQGKDIIFSQGCIARVALMDDYFTEDDSSLVSAEFASLMSNNVTKREQIAISGTANLVQIVKEGEYIEHGSPLLMFEDSTDDDDETQVNQILEMLGDIDEDALNKLKYHSPKAHATGTISKINMYWTGEVEEMSESCAKLVRAYIKKKKADIAYEEENTGVKSAKDYLYRKSIPEFTGRTPRINGVELLEENCILIEFFITHESVFGVGDKSSTYPALKSVCAEVVPKHLAPMTESGHLDICTSQLGMGNRKIISTVRAGTIGKILLDFSKKVADEYLK